MTKAPYYQYITLVKSVLARELLEPEVVPCYNGNRRGEIGDFVVIDNLDRLMVMKRANFLKTYCRGNDDKSKLCSEERISDTSDGESGERIL